MKKNEFFIRIKNSNGQTREPEFWRKFFVSVPSSSNLSFRGVVSVNSKFSKIYSPMSKSA